MKITTSSTSTTQLSKQLVRRSEEIIDESVEWLKKDPQFLYVFDEEKISETTMPNWIKERIAEWLFPWSFR